jgi:hypothetical protein
MRVWYPYVFPSMVANLLVIVWFILLLLPTMFKIYIIILRKSLFLFFELVESNPSQSRSFNRPI